MDNSSLCQKPSDFAQDPKYLAEWAVADSRGRSDAIKATCKKYYAAMIQDTPLVYVPDQYVGIRTWLMDNGQEPKVPSYQCGYVYVTVNAKKEIAPEKLYQKCLQFKHAAWCETWIAVLEFHTDGENHPHIHMLCKKAVGNADKPKSQVIREVYSTFKDFCASKEAIHVRMLTDPSPQLDYIFGKKYDASKHDLVGQDILLRDKLKIPHVFGPWLPELKGSGAKRSSDSSYSGSQSLESSLCSTDGYEDGSAWSDDDGGSSKSSSDAEDWSASKGDDYWEKIGCMLKH